MPEVPATNQQVDACLREAERAGDLFRTGEAAKELGQAPRSYAKSLQNTDIRSEPVPFFHSLGTE